MIRNQATIPIIPGLKIPLENSPAMSRISPVDAESVEVQTELSLMPNNRPNRGTVENRIKELKEEVEALKDENLQLHQQNQDWF